MTKNLTKPNNSRDLSLEHRLYLLNLANGRVFPWQPYLAVQKGFIDCTQDGKPVNPKDVPGNHSWIKQQTQGLKDRLSSAGASAHTLQDVGRQLTDDAAVKFKSLEYERAKKMLQHVTGVETMKFKSQPAAQVGATIRVMNKLDASVQRAKDEINEMAVQAIMSHGFKRWEACRRIGI